MEQPIHPEWIALWRGCTSGRRLPADDLFFVGYQSPPPNMDTDGQAWDQAPLGSGRVVMGVSATTQALVPITGTVQRIFIVFDEGSDIVPNFFGAAFLDNIDVNGQLVGKG